MKALLSAACAIALAAGTANAAVIFSDGFEDGNHNLNPSWTILALTGVNESHANRWTTSSASPITGTFSELWDDIPCVESVALGDCFPLGVLYHEPAPG
ncbi:MAG: hypothetical protein ACREQ9_05315, partial [Candidatus Binatia bacterium]